MVSIALNNKGRGKIKNVPGTVHIIIYIVIRVRSISL